MTWFIFSLLSISVLATADIFQQKLLNSSTKFKELTSTVFTVFIQSLFTIPVLLVTGTYKNVIDIFDWTILPYIAAVSTIGAIAVFFYFKSFKVKNISLSTMFASFSVVVSTTAGIIFFNETLYLHKVLGIVLILGALISLNIKNFHLEKNHLYGLVAGMFFGIAYSLDKRIVTDIPPLVYIFWSFALLAFISFLFNPKSVVDDVRGRKLKEFLPILVSGLGYFLYNFFTFNAYIVGGEVGRVDAINNSQVFLIILFEYLILKQQEGFLRKVITAIVAFTGVLILGFL